MWAQKCVPQVLSAAATSYDSEGQHHFVGITHNILAIQILEFLAVHYSAADLLCSGRVQINVAAFELVSHVLAFTARANKLERQ